MESRLDRIEKGIESLFKGIVELKNSQKKTDSQIQELKNSQKKTDEQLRRTDEQLRKTDEQLQKTDEQLRKTDIKLERIGIQMGNLGLVQGEVAEELFYRNLSELFKKRNIIFKRIRRNVKRKGIAEFDIVAINGGRILVVEVKNKLEKRMVDRFVEERLPQFKELFPEYRDLKLEGGIGALVVKDEVGRYAEKAGLYVLTQTNEGGAALLNRGDFNPREFQ